MFSNTQYVTSNAYISYGTKYYGMQAYYDTDFFGASGTILIYDK